jgi:hypothetical protein
MQQWTRSHLSFANVISVLALFVALGGTSFAAVQLSKNSVGAKQIKKNAVRASEIKSNAVGASEIRSNAVAGGDVADGTLGSGDLADNSVGSSELSDNSVGNGELANNSVGTGEVTDNALTASDITGSTLDPEIGPDLFARVQANGTLQPNVAGFPPQNKGTILISKGEGGAATGTYCFDLPARPASAQVTLDNADAAAADRNVVASVALDRGEDLGDCPANRNDARVRIVDTDDAETVKDARFFIWFEL